MSPIGSVGRSVRGRRLPDAIPDSEDLHAWYPFNVYESSQTSNFDDESGNGHDLDNGSITGMTTIDGRQAGEFDGIDDEVSSSTFSDIKPATVFLVVDMAADQQDQAIVGFDTDSAVLVAYGVNSEDEWELNTDRNLIASGSDHTATVLTGVFAGNDDGLLRQDGSEIVSGTSISARNIEFVNLGSRGDDRSLFYEGAIGEMVVYPDIRTASQIEDVESYLADKWGATLS